MYLDLYGNKLTALPLEIGQLKNLTVLDLRENPLNESVRWLQVFYYHKPPAQRGS